MATPHGRNLLGGGEAFVLLLGLQFTFSQFHFQTPKPEGVQCATQGDNVWTCQRDCYVFEALESVGQRITCFKNESLHLVCCPPPPKPNYNTASISQRKCLEYQSVCQVTSMLGSSFTHNEEENGGVGENEDAKLKKTKQEEDYEDIWASSENGSQDSERGQYGIRNGNKSAPGEFPHSALIGYDENDRISWKCGGTLISERYVLSAAHCNRVYSEDFGVQQASWVRLGELNFATEDDRVSIQQFRIEKSIPHKGYKSSTFYNDIVLFKLDKDAVFDRFVTPACLYNHMDDPPGEAIATGWGFVEKHLDRSTHLMKVDLNFMPHELCNSRIKELNSWKIKIPTGIDKKTMICAWKADKDTCQGDSGGPLVLANKENGCLATLVGITSFGYSDCEYSPYPSVYVRVANFIPWIESIVWPDEASNSGPPTK